MERLVASLTLNTLSRLKGIETFASLRSPTSLVTLNTLSRLKGIETVDTAAANQLVLTL